MDMLEFSRQLQLKLPQLETRMDNPRGQDASRFESEAPPDASSGIVLLDGEYATNVVAPISYALGRRRGGGGEFDGALHVTNFRLVLQRTGRGKATCGYEDDSLEWISFPLSCIKAVVQADEDPLALTLTAKDLRSCRVRFPSNKQVFVGTLAQIILSMAGFAQASPEKSFAFSHAHAAARRHDAKGGRGVPEGERGVAAGTALNPRGKTATDIRSKYKAHTAKGSTKEGGGAPTNSDGPDKSASSVRRRAADLEDGWLAYDAETEFVRQGLIRSKSLDSHEGSGAACCAREKSEENRWRLFHNRSHELVPTYPLFLVVPTAMSDADIRAVASYRSKGRLPAVTWMDPKTKAVLARSAQPLAGLGGKSCAEDERLLRLFHEQGQNPQIPQPTAPPPAPAPVQAPGSVSPIRPLVPSADVCDRRTNASPQPTFDISPVRQPAATPDLGDRRVSFPPRQAFDDIPTRRRDARAQQRRDAALAGATEGGEAGTSNYRRSPSQMYVDVTAHMLGDVSSGGIVGVNGHGRRTTKDRRHKQQSVVRRSNSKRNKGRPSRQAVPAMAITDGDVADRERRSKSDPGDALADVIKRPQQTQAAGEISSFLDMVKMPNWSPPWSMTTVNVQSEQQQPRQETLAANAGKVTRTSSTTPTKFRLGGASSCSSSRQNSKTSWSATAAAASRTDPQYVDLPPTNSGPENSPGWKMGGLSRHGRSTAAWEGEHRSGEGEGEDGSQQLRLCVLDARTAVAALGNQLVGKGVEMGLGNGKSTQVVFSGIGNIHAVNDAFEELRNALDPLRTRLTERRKEDSFMADIVSRGLGLSKTLDLAQALGEELDDGGGYVLWPKLIRQIMAASVLPPGLTAPNLDHLVKGSYHRHHREKRAARLLRLTGCSVLVHCSDGWDRTPQICATAQLLLDPFYRTLVGFCVLIEKEWLSFGHRFWARCMGGTHDLRHDGPAHSTAHGSSSAGSPMRRNMSGGRTANGNVKQYDELSPVFLQFLDLVHNLVAQFPAAFEFNEELLGFVAEHTFSGLFGTFLCDTERRRKSLKLVERTVSIWTVVLSNKEHFVNPGYKPTEDPLWPSLAPCKVRLWERQHCRLPGLRAHHLLSGQKPWEDGVSTTARLLQEGGKQN